MTPGEVTAWLPGMFDAYVLERVRAGEDPASARQSAEQQHEQLFPDGQPGESQHVMHVVADDRVVGVLWIGRPLRGESSAWYVFNIEIDESARGLGYGREAMLAAERWALANGGTRLGLNVFGPNVAARSLYDSLGYQVAATQMFKELAANRRVD